MMGSLTPGSKALQWPMQCWQTKVLKTPMVTKSTVEELRVLEPWVREQVREIKLKLFCGRGRGSLWP